MSTAVNVPLLQTRTINQSGDYDVTLGVSSRIIVERNASTPSGDAVAVSFDTLSVGLLSSVTVDHATLTIDALASASVLTAFTIGDGGRLDLSGTVDLNVLSPITFGGVGGILELGGSTASISLLSAIQGFNGDDVFVFDNVAHATGVTYTGGRIVVHDGATTVASVAVTGDFDPGQLGFQSNGQGGIHVGIGLGNGGGLPNDIYATGLHSEYRIAETSLDQLYLQDKVDGRDVAQTVGDAKYILFADGIGRFDPTGNAGTVAHLYQAAFDRTPDAGGLDFWTGRLDAGTATEHDVASAFTSTAEFRSAYGGFNNTDYVKALYENVLDRAGDAGGVSFWTSQLNGGTGRDSVLQSFAGSFENVVNSLRYTGDHDYGDVYRLYQAAFDRTPDAGGLEFWYGRIQGGQSLQSVSQFFTQSDEFNDRYGNLGNQSFVQQLYANVLDRAPDAGGANFWVGALASGTAREDVLIGFSNSLENQLLTADATHDHWVYLGAG